ncbi:pyridoxal-phosphate dependent enzyme [Paraflavitalea sp. CAU 1676]|uniref:1-aminocyclopropane-1-carboxylate deaminase/D-cysteine desulfhydrase n=1 Tax=Paraflavitalea sp. CAU 1676 TaxID=3032598 RepID=UPI0023DB8009|nr:pyridoxal-phosphate dependent enzyme [Paraflavitalea sp. CAU 1676]MDF2191767.1 pyridoxal-phosphate dependent enzyme [Paraflavitalea sp. CAU 1676]
MTHEQWRDKGVRVAVLRLDLIHPVLSGNKWFKLKYHLQQAFQLQKKGILTFGGAYSNHLVATAIACNLEGLAAIGIVRGEEPAVLSHTLHDTKRYGMQIQYVPRSVFQHEQALIDTLQQQYPDYLIVPAGGQSAAGVQGAAEILSLTNAASFTHVACAAGTGTMFSGIINSIAPHQQVLGFSSLKLANHDDNSLLSMIGQHSTSSSWQLIYDYHFGGYARKNDTLLAFMNQLYQATGLPTDFVYTGKLMYGLYDLIQQGYFQPGSEILAIHSGGLQGNRSLPAGTLCF